MTIVIPPSVRRLASVFGADLPGVSRTPTVMRFIAAAVVAVLLSLAVCALVASTAIRIDPSLAGYEHLQLPDWAKLTIVGVGGATLGWPLAAAIWSRARIPFLILTAIVTVVSLAPDLWILHLGQPAAGVLALVVMHVGVAIVTYPALVLIAPQRRAGRSSARSER